MKVWYVTGSKKPNTRITVTSGRFRTDGSATWIDAYSGAYNVYAHEEGIVETEDLAALERCATILGVEP